MTHDIETDLSLRRAGRTGGPLLLFLHGLTDSGSGWPGAEEHWGPTYTVVTLDQRGHGDSPRFSVEQLAGHPGDVLVDDAVRVLEQLEKPPVVLGHSLGGAVALAAAVRRPELVRGVVLEDPAPLGPDEPLRDPVRGEEFLTGLAASLGAHDDAELLAARKEAHPDWPEDELLVTGRAERAMDLAFLRGGEWKPSATWPELFRELRVATLLVTGDRSDEVVVTDKVERGIVQIANPHVEIRRIPGAGHCVRRENPTGYYAAVDGFLARLP